MTWVYYYIVMNEESHETKLESRYVQSLQRAPHPYSCSKVPLPALWVFLYYSSYQLLTCKITYLLCVLLIASFINARILFFFILFVDVSHVQEQSLAHSKPSLCVAILTITCLSTVPLPSLSMFHWWKDEGQKPPGDLLKMTQWASWQEEEKNISLLTAQFFA